MNYRHVVIAGVDGAGAFLKDANTPEMDRIFARGAVTYEALASNPTISAECWGSMLTGVSPLLHGLSNALIAKRPYPEDSPFPTLYKRLRRAFPEKKIAAYCDWTPLITGVAEESAGVDCLSLRDEELIAPACEYLIENKPVFMFVHMDSVDGAGHANGYGTEKYMAQIEIADGYVGRLFEACKRAGIEEDTLFCVVSDHGGTCEIKEDGTFFGRHGGLSDEERLISFLARGRTVKSGKIGKMNIRDIAAVTLHALGLPVPEFEIGGWTAQIPENLFEGYDGPYFDISGEEEAAARVSQVRHTSESV